MVPGREPVSTLASPGPPQGPETFRALAPVDRRTRPRVPGRATAVEEAPRGALKFGYVPIARRTRGCPGIADWPQRHGDYYEPSWVGWPALAGP